MKRKYVKNTYKYSYRKGTQKVRSKCTRRKPCQNKCEAEH